MCLPSNVIPSASGGRLINTEAAERITGIVLAGIRHAAT
jgi:hypothetical protein